MTFQVLRYNKHPLWLCLASALKNPYDFKPAFNCHNVVIYIGFYSATSRLHFHNEEAKSRTGPDSAINHTKAVTFVMLLHREFYAQRIACFNLNGLCRGKRALWELQPWERGGAARPLTIREGSSRWSEYSQVICCTTGVVMGSSVETGWAAKQAHHWKCKTASQVK